MPCGVGLSALGDDGPVALGSGPKWRSEAQIAPFILFLFILYFPSSIPKFNLNFEFEFNLCLIYSQFMLWNLEYQLWEYNYIIFLYHFPSSHFQKP
jgi:hypothetical protein